MWFVPEMQKFLNKLHYQQKFSFDFIALSKIKATKLKHFLEKNLMFVSYCKVDAKSIFV